MAILKSKMRQREQRHRRIRAKISGTAPRPRLSIFRSNRYLYAQLIDDEAGTTVAAASSVRFQGKTGKDAAREVGKAIAALAREKKITAAVFDRGGYRYAGSIKAIADGAREGGLTF